MVKTYKYWLPFLFIILFTASPSIGSYVDTGNPGSDQPDRSYLLGKEIFKAPIGKVKPHKLPDARVAIVDRGFSREAQYFLGLFTPIRIVSMSDLSSNLSSIDLLVIPSGGLHGIINKDMGKRLAEYISRGGNILIFAQMHGKDYSILPHYPKEKISAYGWLESQSALAQSSTIGMLHPCIEGIGKSRLNINIDGLFIKYPGRGKVVLRDTRSGQPVLLIWRYGRGNVIATALFTDWAYLHGRTTWDEIIIFCNLLKWVRIPLLQSAPDIKDRLSTNVVSPVPLPPLGFSVHSEQEVYKVGSKARCIIHVWNYGDKTRTIKIYYEKEGYTTKIPAHGHAVHTGLVSLYSSRRIWIYFYDEKNSFLQTVRKGFTVIYPESKL